MVDETFLFGVAVEAGDRAQPPPDSRPGPAEGLEVAAELFDVGPADTEQREVAFCAPGGELAQVEPVGLEREAAVAGQEPGQGELLRRR